ncbi:MAG: hypothetical protein K2Q09_09355, partial [Phycisphaerales bacterium]|nr:hypothetical protein [Phycisphaerales bacterium]
MNRKRGAPVLIELITRPNGPSVSGSPVPPYPAEINGRGGHPVSDPSSWSTGGAGAAGAQWRLPALLVGGGIVVVVLAALLGYQLGQKREKQEWAEKNAGSPPPVAPAPNGAKVHDPLANGSDDHNAALGGGVVRPAPQPAPGPAQGPELKDGWNYLVVATSMRRADAEQALKYLADNQVACELLPYQAGGGGRVDRSGGSVNNGLWQLWVLEGVPKDKYYLYGKIELWI